MFLLTHGLVRGGWGGRAPLRVEQALEERGVRDRVGVRTGIVSFDTINDDGAGDNEGHRIAQVHTLGESCERLLTCGTRPDTGATFRQSRRTPYAEIAINISGITDNDSGLKTLANPARRSSSSTRNASRDKLVYRSPYA